MCILYKGFRGFRAVSPVSILGGNLIGLKPAIAYYAYTQRCSQCKNDPLQQDNDRQWS